jgi:hypothetical protein
MRESAQEESRMRFYNRQHRHYCGIDLHVKTMYICILDSAGQVLVHRNVKSTPEAFLFTIVREAKRHDADAFHRLRSVPGIRKVLALTILDEIHDVTRFDRVQEFASYARLVKCVHQSAGKKLGTGGVLHALARDGLLDGEVPRGVAGKGAGEPHV